MIDTNKNKNTKNKQISRCIIIIFKNNYHIAEQFNLIKTNI